MNKKNVLIIVSGSVIGGHESQAYEIAADLINIGHSVTIICSAQSTFDYFKSLSCELKLINFIIPGKIWKQWFNSSKVEKILRDHIVGFDKIIVSAGTIEGLIAVSHAIKEKSSNSHVIGYVPMYIDRSLTHGIVGKIYNCMLNQLGRAVDTYLTINKIQAAVIVKNLKRPTHFVQNKIRTVKPPERSYGKRLIYVGRFDDKQKGLIDLLSILDNSVNPYRNLVMIGDGPDKEQLVEKVQSLKFLNVEFPGWLTGDRLEGSLGTEDVLIMNSRWEGEPLVVREFSERGLVSISRDITGVRGLIKRQFRFKDVNELNLLLERTYKNEFSEKEKSLMRFRRNNRIESLMNII